MSEKEAVLETLEDYARAYCDKDIEQLMSVFDDGEDISLIGTGADELCPGRTAVRKVFLRNFAAAKATKFEWHWRHVTVSGDAAIVAITLAIHLDTADGSLRVPIRWTVSLSKKAGRWRWLHRHASTAASSQQDGTAYPISRHE